MIISEVDTAINMKDIQFIQQKPWKISEKEWMLKNNDMWDQTLASLKQRLSLAKKDGYTRIWRISNDEPIALLAGFKVADKLYETLFIASEHMDKYALELSFDMRKILRDKAPYYKGCKCFLYSESDHPSLISWFRFLGFQYIPSNNLGSNKYFEYVSKKK